MTIQTILESYHTSQNISEDTIAAIQDESDLRKEMVHYFINNRDREFATALLSKFTFIRKQPNGNMPFEDLMLACYILGLHGQVEDSIKIWEAKYADFDTYCGLDIQLVSFAGLWETLNFLKEQGTADSQKAFDYIVGCTTKGDFDPSLNQYFALDNLLWYI